MEKHNDIVLPHSFRGQCGPPGLISKSKSCIRQCVPNYERGLIVTSGEALAVHARTAGGCHCAV